MDPGTEPSRAHEADVELTIKGSWAESPLTLWVLAAVALLVFAIAGAIAVRGA